MSHWRAPSGCSPLPPGPPSMGQSSCLMSQCWAAGSCPPSAALPAGRGPAPGRAWWAAGEAPGWHRTRLALDKGGAQPSRGLGPPALGFGVCEETRFRGAAGKGWAVVPPRPSVTQLGSLLQQEGRAGPGSQARSPTVCSLEKGVAFGALGASHTGVPSLCWGHPLAWPWRQHWVCSKEQVPSPPRPSLPLSPPLPAWFLAGWVRKPLGFLFLLAKGVAVGEGCLPPSLGHSLWGVGSMGWGSWGGDSRAVSTAGPGVATPTRLRAESPVLSQTLLPGPQRAAPGGRGTSTEGRRWQHVSEPGPRA